MLVAWMAVLVLPAEVRAEKWDPVAPEDLAAEKSAEFPDADEEILLSIHTLDESSPGAEPRIVTGPRVVTEHFVRAKCYTEKGVKRLGKVLIDFPMGWRLTDLEARVVKRSGASILLQDSDFVESVVAKDEKGDAWKQVAIVFPGLQAGDIVEYRWKERYLFSFRLIAYNLQDEYPTREYRFSVKKSSDLVSICWLNCKEASSDKKHGFSVTFRNIPGFEREVHMPPEREVRGWIYLTKMSPVYRNDAEMWPHLSHDSANDFDQATKPKEAVKEKAKVVTAGATSDEEKLRRIYAFCQNDVVNSDYMDLAELRPLVDKHRSEDPFGPTEILAAKRGRSDEINQLFAAMARAIGFEVKEALNAHNTDFVMLKIAHAWAFFQKSSVAVKLAGHWSFFDPGSYCVPFGMMRSQEEKANALICDLKKTEFAEIPTSTVEQNQQQYRGRFTLDADGTLEGEISESFFGQLATGRKEHFWGDAVESVNEAFRAEVAKRLPNAELTEIVWTNLHNNVMPLSVKYHVRVTGFAEKTGRRLVLPPSFFRVGKPPVFNSTDRKFPVFFPYPWSEHDDIEITLPEGFVLDNPSSPAPVGDRMGAMGSSYRLRFDPQNRILAYQRDFALGANGPCRFTVESYPALKKLFELVQKADTHVLVLKPASTGVSKGTESTTGATPPAGQP